MLVWLCTACGANEFACAGRPCLSRSFLCDGWFHCPDLSDERDCACNGTGYWYHQQHLCNTSRLCVLRCNKVAECDDGSDEAGCGAYTNPVSCSYFQRLVQKLLVKRGTLILWTILIYTTATLSVIGVE